MPGGERPVAIRFAASFGLVAGDFDDVEAPVDGHDTFVDRPAGRVEDVPSAPFYLCGSRPAWWELGGGVAVLADHDPAAFFAVAGSGGDVPNGLPPQPSTLGPTCCWDVAICSDGSSPRGPRGDYISCPPCCGDRKAVRSRLSKVS